MSDATGLLKILASVGAVRATERRVGIDLWYPRVEGEWIVDTIDIGLTDVRAADGFRVHYDYERDGFVLTREVLRQVVGLPEDALECTGTWREVAFVPADWDAPVELPAKEAP